MMNFEFMPFFGSAFVGMPFWWLLIIAVTAALLKWLIRPRSPQGRVQSSLEILRERFARGEIDREEFEEKKKDLT